MAALEGFWRDMGWLMLLGLLVVVLYIIVQIYFMSRDGQSLGKKIMGIRVLKQTDEIRVCRCGPDARGAII